MGAVDQTLVDELVAAGIPAERARSVAARIEIIIDARYSLHVPVLATKPDLADLEIKLVRETAQHSERMADKFALINERISQVSIQVADTKADLLKFRLGGFIAHAGLMLGAMKYLR